MLDSPRSADANDAIFETKFINFLGTLFFQIGEVFLNNYIFLLLSIISRNLISILFPKHFHSVGFGWAKVKFVIDNYLRIVSYIYLKFVFITIYSPLK